jgi:hypothetical protein
MFQSKRYVGLKNAARRSSDIVTAYLLADGVVNHPIEVANTVALGVKELTPQQLQQFKGICEL